MTPSDLDRALDDVLVSTLKADLDDALEWIAGAEHHSGCSGGYPGQRCKARIAKGEGFLPPDDMLTEAREEQL